MMTECLTVTVAESFTIVFAAMLVNYRALTAVYHHPCSPLPLSVPT